MKPKPKKAKKAKTERLFPASVRRRQRREPCFQCELDIPHVCFFGINNAKWGYES